MPDQNSSDPQDNTANDPVWTYRGYHLKAGEFNTAMVHLYRGEISRANVWRSGWTTPLIGRSSLSAIFTAEGSGQKTGQRAWYRSGSKRAQLVALVIGSQQSEKLGQAILSELHRGVTRFEATGMYTGKPHAVLLVALTVTEVNHLKALVSDVEPTAFVIVMPAQEVWFSSDWWGRKRQLTLFDQDL